MIDFNEMSKREYDELGFLYEQRYGPYKPFKEGIIVENEINPYIRQLMDIVYDTGVGKINIDTVEKFLFFKIPREDSCRILSLLLRNKVISEQGKLLMNHEEYTKFINILLNETKPQIELLKQENIKKLEDQTEENQQSEVLKYKIEIEEIEVPEIGDNKVNIRSFKYLFAYMIIMGLLLFLCAMTYRVLGFAFMIPAFVITGAYLYKYSK
ncbi:hypothetical protein [Lacrimispora sp.]|uniref:hypothetical protein n=1 Tax=Lacrimispora sp. TaxID=2719234 RepID=UPI00399266FA